MNQNVNGISQYLNVLSDPMLQQYARQAGINALGNRQQLIQQLAMKLASQGYEVSLAGRGNQAVGLNTAFGGFNQNYAQQGYSQQARQSLLPSVRSNSNGSRLSQGARTAQYNLQDLQRLPSFDSGKVRATGNRSPLRNRSVNQVGQGFDLRTRRGGNNPSGVNQYSENDRYGSNGGSSKSRTDANRGVFHVSPVRTNPLSPSTRKVEQTLRNTNGYQGAQTALSPRALSPRISPRLSQQTALRPRALSPRLSQQTALSPRFMSPLANRQSIAQQNGLTVLPSGSMVGNVSPMVNNGSLGQAFAPQSGLAQRAMSPMRTLQQTQGFGARTLGQQGLSQIGTR